MPDAALATYGSDAQDADFAKSGQVNYRGPWFGVRLSTAKAPNLDSVAARCPTAHGHATSVHVATLSCNLFFQIRLCAKSNFIIGLDGGEVLHQTSQSLSVARQDLTGSAGFLYHGGISLGDLI